MKTTRILIFLLVIAGILAACAPAASPEFIPSPTQGPVQAETPLNSPTPKDGTPPGDSAQTETPAASLPAAVTAAQKALAQQLGVPDAQVQVVRFEQVDWPNGCLGIQRMGVLCTQLIVPGYRVILQADSKSYEFRTNASGSVVLSTETAAGTPLPEVLGSGVVWEQSEGSACSRAEIGSQSVEYGPCGGTLKEAPLASGRVEELNTLLAAYASFSQATKAGKVEFNGQGQQDASEAEMRSIAEWASLVYQEAQAGKSSPEDGLAFNWHREGGFAGFCDDLTVYRTGWALASSCKVGQARQATTYRLSAGELKNLYTWVDQLKSFDYEHKDAATADAMLVRVSLVGTGPRAAAPAQQEAIAGTAGEIYANALNK